MMSLAACVRARHSLESCRTTLNIKKLATKCGLRPNKRDIDILVDATPMPSDAQHGEPLTLQA